MIRLDAITLHLPSATSRTQALAVSRDSDPSFIHQPGAGDRVEAAATSLDDGHTFQLPPFDPTVALEALEQAVGCRRAVRPARALRERSIIERDDPVPAPQAGPLGQCFGRSVENFQIYFEIGRKGPTDAEFGRRSSRAPEIRLEIKAPVEGSHESSLPTHLAERGSPQSRHLVGGQSWRITG